MIDGEFNLVFPQYSLPIKMVGHQKLESNFTAHGMEWQQGTLSVRRLTSFSFENTRNVCAASRTARSSYMSCPSEHYWMLKCASIILTLLVFVRRLFILHFVYASQTVTSEMINDYFIHFNLLISRVWVSVSVQTIFIDQTSVHIILTWAFSKKQIIKSSINRNQSAVNSILTRRRATTARLHEHTHEIRYTVNAIAQTICLPFDEQNTRYTSEIELRYQSFFVLFLVHSRQCSSNKSVANGDVHEAMSANQIIYFWIVKRAMERSKCEINISHRNVDNEKHFTKEQQRSENYCKVFIVVVRRDNVNLIGQRWPDVHARNTLAHVRRANISIFDIFSISQKCDWWRGATCDVRNYRALSLHRCTHFIANIVTFFGVVVSLGKWTLYDSDRLFAPIRSAIDQDFNRTMRNWRRKCAEKSLDAWQLNETQKST